MKKAEHRARHIELHKALDELMADYLMHNRGAAPSTTTLRELMEWSFKQTFNPVSLRRRSRTTENPNLPEM